MGFSQDYGDENIEEIQANIDKESVSDDQQRSINSDDEEGIENEESDI